MQRTAAEDLLEDFSLEELLEMNDITETEVLDLLIRRGLVSQPEVYFQYNKYKETINES